MSTTNAEDGVNKLDMESTQLKTPNRIKEVECQDDVRHKSIWRQILATSAPLILMTNNGMVTGFSAILLPQLNEPDSLINVNRHQESWIASMAPLQMAVGCIFSGFLMERFGRKTTLIAAAALSIFGWLFIIFGTSTEHLLLGRFITGFAVGLSCLSISCFIGEVSDPRYRGIFLSGIALGIALGTVVSHALGVFWTWRTTALVIAIFPAVTIALMCMVPESHIWYIDKHDFKRAKEAYFWFRGAGNDAQLEIENILEERTKTAQKRAFKDLLDMCSKAQFIKPFLLACLLFIMSQLTGNNAVVFYSVTIMQSTVEGLNKYAAMLIVDVVRVVMAVVACILMKRFQTRLLAIISGVGTSLSLFLLSTLIYLSNQNSDNKLFSTIPLLTFVSYIVFSSVGLLPLSWAICGEIFPPATKGIGGGISSTINFIAFFLVVKTNPDMFDLIGIPATFSFYAAATLFGTVLLYFFLPETKGRTLEEIQEFFCSKRGLRGK